MLFGGTFRGFLLAFAGFCRLAFRFFVLELFLFVLLFCFLVSCFGLVFGFFVRLLAFLLRFFLRLLGLLLRFFLLLFGGFCCAFVRFCPFALFLFACFFMVARHFFFVRFRRCRRLRFRFALSRFAFNPATWAFLFGPALARKSRAESVAVVVTTRIAHFDKFVVLR